MVCLRADGIRHVFHYLDDFVVLGAPGSDECSRALEKLRSRCTELGIPLAAHKCEGPSTKITFLGIVIDTSVGELSIPAEKLNHLRDLLEDWGDRKSCSLKDLESLIGYLNHACKVIRPGRSFLRRMIDLLHRTHNKYHPIRLNRDFRSDLQCWRHFAACWMAPLILLLVRHPAFLLTRPETGDAAPGTVTYGFNGNGKVLCYCDNQAVVAVLQSRSSAHGKQSTRTDPAPDSRAAARSVGRLDISSLDAAVQNYFHSGLAPSTHRSYDAAMRRFSRFCIMYDIYSPFPVSEQLLCYFASALAVDGLASQTIKAYLSAVRSMQISLGLPPPRDQSTLPILKRVLDGIRRCKSLEGSRPRTRLPITPAVLRRIRAPLIESNGPDGPLGDVAIDARSATSMIKIHLRKSKCDQFGNGADILLGRTGCELCPVSAIMTFIGLRRSTPGHFFVDHQEKPIVKSHFVAKVRDALRTAGYPEEQFAGHSFRIGAATSAAMAGVEDSMIQTLGRWHSAAFLRYIRTPQIHLAAATASLAKATMS
ncbi:hypothetical protein EMCRGX_G003911 [Ephydatia muelleri]